MQTPQPKRLIVLADGTWQTPENPTPTNILKLTKAIKTVDSDGAHQIIFYDAGLGTTGDALDRVMAGGFGAGIDINIQGLYTFLALNYNEGDEIYLFGFSRGSYTVRSLCGLINESGLVRRDHLDFVKEAYDLYRENEDIESDLAQSFRAEHGDRVPITLLACFDTVGSLGLPMSGSFISKFTTKLNRRYEFHDISLSPIIKNAIHLVAIDEDREIFAPTLMEAHPETPNQLTQLFFPGTHGGVGGGCAELVPLADCALRFMVDEISRRELNIEIDNDQIPQGDPTAELPPNEPSRLFKVITSVTGKFIRQIETLDRVHLPTVKARYRSCPDWRPKNLEPYHDMLLADDGDD